MKYIFLIVFLVLIIQAKSFETINYLRKKI